MALVVYGLSYGRLRSSCSGSNGMGLLDTSRC